MESRITEYTITFEDIDEEDFITEDKQEADEKFEELKENGELYKVHQYYAKDWVYDEEIGDWEEDYVEVFYTKEENLEEKKDVTMYIDEYYPSRKEAQEAEKILKKQGKKTKIEKNGNEYILWTSYEKVTEEKEDDDVKYNVYTLTGADGVYNSRKVDTVDSQDQAVDRVAELNAENGGGAYYIKVVNGKEIEENKKVIESDNTDEVLDRNMTFGYAFQLSRYDIFYVEYKYLGDNKTPYFSTSADRFNKRKSDYNEAGQAQENILPDYKEAYDFYKKWDNKHLLILTKSEYDEMQKDLDVLKNTYNYIQNTNGDFTFSQIVDLSKQKPKVTKKTEAVDSTQTQEQEIPVEDPIDTTEELTDGIKKEIYQYAKQQGLDIEKLRKQGIELETLSDTLDKVIGDMVSKTAIEYMDKTGTEITWDFDVANNDINVIWNTK